MTHRTTDSIKARSFLPDLRSTLTAGFTAAALLAGTLSVRAQDTTPAPDPTAATQPAATQPGAAQPPTGVAISNQKTAKTRKAKDEKVVASKDTKKEDKKVKKDDPLLGVDAKLPDKALYDKAEDAIKKGRFDVGRLDLQTLLNTYPDSQYMMRAKLAVADSWYKEGGTAALTQAEQEYKDFITFFPNAPEAAEAQMRVGDIYFRQMDKPDRDYTNTTHSEEEYRLMLQQFPDSPLVPQARGRLREVQEVMASREADIASFYATRQPPNLIAAIARYQTIVDTYPLYSHMDEMLIGIGDLYESEAKYIRMLKLPEAAKARLEKIYDDNAANAYRKVILEHSAAPRVEDARDRLVGMGLPVPTPTAEQMAASAALENSRGQYTLSKRATVFFLHQADTVQAATVGNPPLEDPKPTLAPTIARQAQTDFVNSLNPATEAPHAVAANQTADTPAAATSDPGQPAAAAPLSLQDVPTAAAPGTLAPAFTAPASSPSTAGGGSGIGVEIVQPRPGETPVTTAPATPPAFPGTQTPATTAPATTPASNPVVAPVGPANATPLAPIEHAAAAPDTVNDAAGGTTTPPATPKTNGKNPKVDCDKSDESCSRHKKKKGLAKLNPF